MRTHAAFLEAVGALPEQILESNGVLLGFFAPSESRHKYRDTGRISLLDQGFQLASTDYFHGRSFPPIGFARGVIALLDSWQVVVTPVPTL
jgi:hypothetical protein